MPGSVLVPHSEADVWTSVVVAAVAAVAVVVAAAFDAVAGGVEAGVAASPGPGTWRWRT